MSGPGCTSRCSPRMHRSFGYDLLEPVRRDFSTVLERCGHDLYRAVEAAARQDYTVVEHARDLAGAAALERESHDPSGGRGGPARAGAICARATRRGPGRAERPERSSPALSSPERTSPVLDQRGLDQLGGELGVPRARSEGQAAAGADGTGHAASASG